MSELELKKTLEALHTLHEDVTSSREKALAFLVKTGIVTSTGDLTPQYKQGA